MEEDYERQRGEIEKIQEALMGNYLEVMRTPAGKAVVWDMLAMCGIYNNDFTGDDQTAFNCGRTSVGLELLSNLNGADPKIYPNLLLEKQDE